MVHGEEPSLQHVEVEVQGKEDSGLHHRVGILVLWFFVAMVGQVLESHVSKYVFPGLFYEDHGSFEETNRTFKTQERLPRMRWRLASQWFTSKLFGVLSNVCLYTFYDIRPGHPRGCRSAVMGGQQERVHSIPWVLAAWWMFFLIFPTVVFQCFRRCFPQRALGIVGSAKFKRFMVAYTVVLIISVFCELVVVTFAAVGRYSVAYDEATMPPTYNEYYVRVLSILLFATDFTLFENYDAWKSSPAFHFAAASLFFCVLKVTSSVVQLALYSSRKSSKDDALQIHFKELAHKYGRGDEDPDSERKHFEYYDKDRTGFVDRGEITNALGNLSDHEIVEVMDAFDVNGDGKLSFLEFYVARLLANHLGKKGIQGMIDVEAGPHVTVMYPEESEDVVVGGVPTGSTSEGGSFEEGSV